MIDSLEKACRIRVRLAEIEDSLKEEWDDDLAAEKADLEDELKELEEESARRKR